jgi:hypothetical protein
LPTRQVVTEDRSHPPVVCTAPSGITSRTRQTHRTPEPWIRIRHEVQDWPPGGRRQPSPTWPAVRAGRRAVDRPDRRACQRISWYWVDRTAVLLPRPPLSDIALASPSASVKSMTHRLWQVGSPTVNSLDTTDDTYAFLVKLGPKLTGRAGAVHLIWGHSDVATAGAAY